MSDQADNQDGSDDDARPIGEEESPSEERNDVSPEQTTSGEENQSQSSDSLIGLSDAQDRAREAAEDFLEHEFEGIIKVEAADDDGWRTVLEVVERSAIPDTQDIIGRYEITLDAIGGVTGYELLERYRRGDMKEEL